MTLKPHSNIRSLETPCLLVALPQLQDKNFTKTVLLLVEHDESGALAFTLNRPLMKPIKDFLDAPELDFPPGVSAWQGGPVGSSNGLVLHNQGGDETHAVAPGISMGVSNLALRGLMAYANSYARIHPPERAAYGHERVEGFNCLYPYRFLVGYAGWGPGQLDEEMRLGCWMQLPLDRELVFNTPWPRMWSAAMDAFGVDPMEIAPTMQAYLN